MTVHRTVAVPPPIARPPPRRIASPFPSTRTTIGRIDAIPPEKLDSEQRVLRDTVMAQLGRVRGPFEVLMHAPDAGMIVASVVEHSHREARVSMRLKEYAILVIARHYTAQYEWLVHEPRARREGVDDATIDALREGRTPSVSQDRELAVVHAVVTEILQAKRVSDETYAAARGILDEPALVELVVHIGSYISIAVLLTTFEVDVPDGDEPPLRPL